mmetsp:Transcript_41994/g.106312  ORF Transcript_41994/g.106312 Transcript_41994/m.106312 type:complete len:226 (-) Transcript_41994:1248-1925(-)
MAAAATATEASRGLLGRPVLCGNVLRHQPAEREDGGEHADQRAAHAPVLQLRDAAEHAPPQRKQRHGRGRPARVVFLICLLHVCGILPDGFQQPVRAALHVIGQLGKHRANRLEAEQRLRGSVATIRPAQACSLGVRVDQGRQQRGELCTHGVCRLHLRALQLLLHARAPHVIQHIDACQPQRDVVQVGAAPELAGPLPGGTAACLHHQHCGQLQRLHGLAWNHL